MLRDEPEDFHPHWPFLVTFRETVFGNGFLAEVVANGRALGVLEEKDDVWLYGVNSGGLAAGGKTGAEAQFNFAHESKLVLYDIANDAPDFGSFKSQVERFFYEKSDDAEWLQAVAEIRAGKGDPIGESMPRKPAETPTTILIEMKGDVGTFKPSANVVEPLRAIAA